MQPEHYTVFEPLYVVVIFIYMVYIGNVPTARYSLGLELFIKIDTLQGMFPCLLATKHKDFHSYRFPC